MMLNRLDGAAVVLSNVSCNSDVSYDSKSPVYPEFSFAEFGVAGYMNSKFSFFNENKEKMCTIHTFMESVKRILCVCLYVNRVEYVRYKGD